MLTGHTWVPCDAVCAPVSDGCMLGALVPLRESASRAARTVLQGEQGAGGGLMCTQSPSTAPLWAARRLGLGSPEPAGRRGLLRCLGEPAADPGAALPACVSLQGKPDLNTALPVRQTASIFKQPVTKITNHPSNKVKSDPQKAVEQPRQVSPVPHTSPGEVLAGSGAAGVPAPALLAARLVWRLSAGIECMCWGLLCEVPRVPPCNLLLKSQAYLCFGARLQTPRDSWRAGAGGGRRLWGPLTGTPRELSTPLGGTGVVAI